MAKYGLRHQPPKLGIVGSNPTGPAIITINCLSKFFVDFNEFFLVVLSAIHNGTAYRKREFWSRLPMEAWKSLRSWSRSKAIELCKEYIGINMKFVCSVNVGAV